MPGMMAVSNSWKSVGNSSIAGCPGRRGPFVSAKGPKTSDAQFGQHEMDRTPDEERTNSFHSDKVRRI